MKTSIYDLGFMFFEKFYNGQSPTAEEKKQAIYNLKQIASKVTAGSVMQVLARWKSENKVIDIQSILQIPYAQAKDTEPNLLTTDRFYLHPELRVTSNPPVIEVNIDSGEMIRHVEPYYLEMAYSYSPSELMNYYLSKEILIPKNYDRKRFEGAFRHLLSKYDIEVILFMIDRAYDEVTSFDKGSLTTPFEIEEHYAGALHAITQCLSQAKEEDGDQIVKKERVLSR